MAKSGYGGILSPIINAIANMITREILVVTGRKKPYRGGARISKARRVVQGKDHPKKEKKR